MSYTEKMAAKEKALGGLEEKKISVEKTIVIRQKNVNKYKRKLIFRAVILLLLLAVAGVTYMLATSDSFMASVTEKLVEATIGTDEELGFLLSSVKETLYEQPGQVEELVIMVVSSLVCVVLATFGAGGTGLGWGLIACLIGMGGMVYVFDGAHIIGYLPIPVCILAVIVKIRDAAGYRKYHARQLEEAVAERDKVLADITVQSAEKEKMEADNRKGAQLYKDAVASGNDEELMRKAASLGNEDAAVYIKQLDAQREAEEAEVLYQQAMEKEEPDTELLGKAAEKGHPLANLYLGKELCRDASSGMYTGREKEDMLIRAVEYLDEAAEAGNIEAEFLAISSRAQYESNSAEKWREMLDRLRVIKKSGLSEEYDEVYTTLVQSVVGVIDKLDNTPPPPPKREPRLVRKYCAFNNCGVCTHYSTSSYLAKCNYLNNPGGCSAALLEKALRYEYE